MPAVAVQPRTVRVAGFWRRFAAGSLDALVLSSVFVALDLAVSLALGQPLPRLSQLGPDYIVDVAVNGDSLAIIGLVLFVIVSFLYFFMFQALRGQTPGQRLLDIRVVDGYGEMPSLGRSLARTFAFLPSWALLALGMVWIAFDREKRGLHDRLADTYVIVGDRDPLSGSRRGRPRDLAPGIAAGPGEPGQRQEDGGGVPAPGHLRRHARLDLVGDGHHRRAGADRRAEPGGAAPHRGRSAVGGVALGGGRGALVSAFGVRALSRGAHLARRKRAARAGDRPARPQAARRAGLHAEPERGPDRGARAPLHAGGGAGLSRAAAGAVSRAWAAKLRKRAPMVASGADPGGGAAGGRQRLPTDPMLDQVAQVAAAMAPSTHRESQKAPPKRVDPSERRAVVTDVPLPPRGQQSPAPARDPVREPVREQSPCPWLASSRRRSPPS